MTDFRHQIPSWAFINAQIAQEAMRSGDLARSVQAVEASYGLPPKSLRFNNSAYLVSLLYCLIVVPKEVWDLGENHPVYTVIDMDWFVGLFTVEQSDSGFKKHPVKYLIHRLRNAVAHANFSIENDERFTFWDQRKKTDKPFFRASITVDGLEKLVTEVGALLANQGKQA